MPAAAAISAAGSIGSGLLGVFGSEQASKQQQAGLSNAISALQGMFNTAYGAINPVINLGTSAASSVLPTLQGLLNPGTATSTLNNLPGFQFAQNWGQKSVQNLGTTMGLGGNTLTQGAQYATGLAQQGYGNIVSLLEGLFSSGGNIAATAAQGLGNTAANFGNSLANAYTGVGNAAASGTLGATNALSSALTGGTSAASNYLALSPFYAQALKNVTNAGSGTGVYSGPNIADTLTSNPVFNG